MEFITEIQEHKDTLGVWGACHVHSRIGVWQIGSGLLRKDGFRVPRAKAIVPSEKETGLRRPVMN
jgi:hypothetical protein